MVVVGVNTVAATTVNALSIRKIAPVFLGATGVAAVLSKTSIRHNNSDSCNIAPKKYDIRPSFLIPSRPTKAALEAYRTLKAN